MPLLAYVLVTGSRRLHSIFVLRMFNDCITMPIMHLCIYAALMEQWTLSSVMFGLALTTKMNVLLFYPALLMLQMARIPRRSLVLNQAAILMIQTVVAIPFLRVNPKGYLSLAYNVNREFQWVWTVNWRFLGQGIFMFLQRSKLLLIIMTISYLVWIGHRRRLFAQASPADVAALFFESNLIGIILSKSLHYQFLAWYSLSIPLLLLRNPTMHWGVAIGAMVAIELCWNVYPSTPISSMVLFSLNLATLMHSLAVPGGDYHKVMME